jgi:hypothetical protein
VTDRRATTFQGSGDRWANLEALGAAAGRKPPKLSSRRRRNLLRTLAIVLALVVVLAGAGALYGYRYADRLVGKGQRPVAGLTPAAASSAGSRPSRWPASAPTPSSSCTSARRGTRR